MPIGTIIIDMNLMTFIRLRYISLFCAFSFLALSVILAA